MKTTFQCTKCGRKTRELRDLLHTLGNMQRREPPECCGQPMIETIED